MRRASSVRCVTLINSQLKGRAVRSDAGVRAHLINYVSTGRSVGRPVLRGALFADANAGARQEGVASRRIASRRVPSNRQGAIVDREGRQWLVTDSPTMPLSRAKERGAIRCARAALKCAWQATR